MKAIVIKSFYGNKDILKIADKSSILENVNFQIEHSNMQQFKRMFMKLKEKSYLLGTNLLVSIENLIPRKNLKIVDLSTRIHD